MKGIFEKLSFLKNRSVQISIGATLLIILLSGAGFLLFPNNKSDSAQKLFRAGQTAFYKKDLDQAIKIYKEVISVDSNQVSAYIMLGKSLFYKSEFEESEAILKKCRKKFAGNMACLFWLGRISMTNEKNHEQSKLIMEEVLEGDDTNFEAHYYLAKLYEKDSNMKEALAEYNKAKVIKVAFEKIHISMSNIYSKMGMDDRAKLELMEIPNNRDCTLKEN